jgi:phosphohistidine phosphatase SixA
MNRRLCLRGLAVSLLYPAIARAQPVDPLRAIDALRRGGGGLVVAMRHALAPGTFDPPGFRLDACSTQRNLSDEGRAQAVRIGAWFREHGLAPTAVRSSEWCRCLDTARLAFASAQPWPALNSIVRDRAAAGAQTSVVRAELARLAAADGPGFEVWVTHQANISALAGGFTGSGEGLLLRHEPGRVEPVIVATLSIA